MPRSRKFNFACPKCRRDVRVKVNSLNTCKCGHTFKIALSAPVNVPLNQIKQGPIQQRSLSEDLKDRIRVLWEKVGHLADDCSCLEQYELSFMRDINPDKEVWLNENIALAWERYYHDTEKGSEDDQARILALLTLFTVTEGAASQVTSMVGTAEAVKLADLILLAARDNPHRRPR